MIDHGTFPQAVPGSLRHIGLDPDLWCAMRMWLDRPDSHFCCGRPDLMDFNPDLWNLCPVTTGSLFEIVTSVLGPTELHYQLSEHVAKDVAPSHPILNSIGPSRIAVIDPLFIPGTLKRRHGGEGVGTVDV